MKKTQYIGLVTIGLLAVLLATSAVGYPQAVLDHDDDVDDDDDEGAAAAAASGDSAAAAAAAGVAAAAAASGGSAAAASVIDSAHTIAPLFSLTNMSLCSNDAKVHT